MAATREAVARERQAKIGRLTNMQKNLARAANLQRSMKLKCELL